MDNADRIHIRDLRLRCILGLQDWEREKKQDITLNLTLHADLKTAGKSDDIADTIDYKAIKQSVIDLVESSNFKLLERLAEAVAEVCLRNERVTRADICIDKPGALRFARSVAVEITRTRA